MFNIIYSVFSEQETASLFRLQYTPVQKEKKECSCSRKSANRARRRERVCNLGAMRTSLLISMKLFGGENEPEKRRGITDHTGLCSRAESLKKLCTRLLRNSLISSHFSRFSTSVENRKHQNSLSNGFLCAAKRKTLSHHTYYRTTPLDQLPKNTFIDNRSKSKKSEE